jgi:hypothetical protein
LGGKIVFSSGVQDSIRMKQTTRRMIDLRSMRSYRR